ncbi:MAG: DNA repair protein RecO C-terminal domain-containing protein [Bacteroidales bacterium]|nr:DNA repair protein RecO C-terminal domain-containing protein [Bacteroidales bacterium]
MPSLSKSQAIVLHLTRHGDSGAVVDVIDSALGRQGLFVRGFGKGRGVSSSAFHSLAVLDVVTYSTSKSSLLYLREYSPSFPLDSIRSDMGKSTMALFMGEVLYRTLKRDDGDPELFRWLVESIAQFEAAQGSVANFHLWWLVGYCVKCGFRPRDNWSEATPCFDMVSAQFLPSDALQQRISLEEGNLFSPDESLLLHRLLNSTADEALAIPLSATRRRAFAEKMINYLSVHFGVTIEIKSLDVLHAVFE